MKYLCVDAIDWADEFDVYFGELVDEETYLKYEFLKEKFSDGLWGSLYFGTNEGWDDDFDYLQFDFEPISDADAEVLKTYGLPTGHNFIENTFWQVEDQYNLNFKDEDENLYDCSLERFKELLNEID